MTGGGGEGVLCGFHMTGGGGGLLCMTGGGGVTVWLSQAGGITVWLSHAGVWVVTVHPGLYTCISLSDINMSTSFHYQLYYGFSNIE